MATRLKRNNAKSVYRTITDYGIITIGMLLGAVGMTFFLLPNQITTGGLMGIASIIYWGTNIPVQNTYFVLNALLIAVALKVLGWRFCAKTIYAVTVFTVSLTVLQHIVDPKLHLLADQKFMACIVGGVFLGTSVGLGLSAGGSTGGSDVVASMVKKYRDVSLGHGILFVSHANGFQNLINALRYLLLIFPSRGLQYEAKVLPYCTIMQKLKVLKDDS